ALWNTYCQIGTRNKLLRWTGDLQSACALNPPAQFRPVETLLTDGSHQTLTIVNWRNIPITLIDLGTGVLSANAWLRQLLSDPPCTGSSASFRGVSKVSWNPWPRC